jgi:hypothetical protein
MGRENAHGGDSGVGKLLSMARSAGRWKGEWGRGLTTLDKFTFSVFSGSSSQDFNRSRAFARAAAEGAIIDFVPGLMKPVGWSMADEVKEGFWKPTGGKLVEGWNHVS